MLEVHDLGPVTQIKMCQTMGGRPLYWVAAYLVDGLLIDTGCHHTRDELAAALADRQIDLIVNTHHHEDHVGADRRLAEDRGLPVFASDKAVPLIARPPSILPYQQLVWGDPEPCPAEPLGERVATAAHEFLVIDAPGHSFDHVVLVEPEAGWCFSGDLFVTEDQTALRADEDVNRIERSLARLAALDVESLTLFTALGQVFRNGRRAIESFLGHLGRLRDQASSLAERGLEPPAIVLEIMGRETGLAGLTGGHYSHENMIRSLLAGAS
jgi:glyoxylase-like metal-dependent hydrolase (beta-lactamase superfamily II)